MNRFRHYQSRMEKLTQRLQARTDHEGNPLAGYRQNVAALRAEIAILQEKMEVTDGER